MPDARDDPQSIHQNGLLSALPLDEWVALEPNLRLVRLKVGRLLSDVGETFDSVYFPTTAIVSILYLQEDGLTMEVASVGSEGMVGVSVVAGEGVTLDRAEVRHAGYSYVLNARLFKREFERGGYLQHLMLLYLQARMAQVAQSALCNRRHSIKERLCSWLLLTQDRLTSPEIDTTQDMIANMLGVRREGVTAAVKVLQDAGLIQGRRGHISILDRPGLERQACECYGIIKREFARLLPDSAPPQVMQSGQLLQLVPSR